LEDFLVKKMGGGRDDVLNKALVLKTAIVEVPYSPK
jgi:hypothetical protein